MEITTHILILAMVGAALSVVVLFISASQRHRGKFSRRSSDGFWSGIFGDSGGSDTGTHDDSHHGHHHHDSGGTHHGGFDGGSHHGGDGGGHH